MQLASMIVAITLCLFATAAPASDIEDTLAALGLVEVPPSAIGATVQDLNPESAYVVSVVDGVLQVERAPLYSDDERSLSIAFGATRYEGHDAGEWVGALVRVGPGGARRTLIEDNVRELYPQGDDLLVFTGMAHLAIDRGEVHRVRNAARSSKVERVTLLPEAPALVLSDAGTPDPEDLLIIGTASLMSLSKLGGHDQLEVHLIDQFWGPLYPNSAVQLDGLLVIGVRGGVVVVRAPRFGYRQHAARLFTTAPVGRQSDGLGVVGPAPLNSP